MFQPALGRFVVISTLGATTQCQLQLSWFRNGSPQPSAHADTLPNQRLMTCFFHESSSSRDGENWRYKDENYRLKHEQFTGNSYEIRKWTATRLTRVYKVRLILHTKCSPSLTQCGVTLASSIPLHCSICHVCTTGKQNSSWKPERILFPPPQ